MHLTLSKLIIVERWSIVRNNKAYTAVGNSIVALEREFELNCIEMDKIFIIMNFNLHCIQVGNNGVETRQKMMLIPIVRINQWTQCSI